MRRSLVPFLLGLLVASALWSVSRGAIRVSVTTVWQVIVAALGGHATPDPREAGVFLNLRLPRVVVAAMVGGALSMAGATLQGVFRNPLADAAVLGISSGAAFAATLVIVLGASVMVSPFVLPLAAFVGAMLSLATVWRLGGGKDASGIILAGVAVNALAGAAIGAVTYIANDAQLRSLTFWTMGSLGAASWDVVAVMAVPVAIAMLGLPALGRALDVLSLGERDAARLGVQVVKEQRQAVVLSALAIGGTVAFVGVVGFVGLVVPHLVRLVQGPSHRGLLVSSGLLGASLVMLADTVARTVAVPAELPLGVVSAAVGAPFFAGLLLRSRARSLA